MRDWMLGGRAARREDLPASVAYCDTAGGDLYRDGADIDLSHWFPNRTPAELRADTSTEIVCRFNASDQADGDFVGFGSHLDTDAVLSMYAFARPERSDGHQQVLVAAARGGGLRGEQHRPAGPRCATRTPLVTALARAYAPREVIPR